jgi:hypothetical protein
MSFTFHPEVGSDDEGHTVDGQTQLKEDAHYVSSLRQESVSREAQGVRVLRLWRDREAEALQLGEATLMKTASGRMGG